MPDSIPRATRFLRLSQDAYYGPMISKKMTAGDRHSVSAFIVAHAFEDADQWTISVREHLLLSDRKNKLLIDDVLTCLR